AVAARRPHLPAGVTDLARDGPHVAPGEAELEAAPRAALRKTVDGLADDPQAILTLEVVDRSRTHGLGPCHALAGTSPSAPADLVDQEISRDTPEVAPGRSVLHGVKRARDGLPMEPCAEQRLLHEIVRRRLHADTTKEEGPEPPALRLEHRQQEIVYVVIFSVRARVVHRLSSKEVRHDDIDPRSRHAGARVHAAHDA